jgi:GntR family transcriptional repressor for pyruvate dehydrogenase complex
MSIRSIARTDIHDDIRERLTQYIQENALRPGDRLPGEEQLASTLGVGRPAVREALRALEAVGAIETRKGVGRFVGAFEAESYIRNFTSESLIASFTELEIAETRCLLEIASIPQAVSRLTNDDLDEIRELLEGMRQKVEAGIRHIDEDLGMHRVIMRHTENRLIATMLDAVYALLSGRAGTDTWAGQTDRRDRADIDLAEHTRLAEAVFARDGRLAQQRLMEHFDTTANRQGFNRSWHLLFGSPGMDQQGNEQKGE